MPPATSPLETAPTAPVVLVVEDVVLVRMVVAAYLREGGFQVVEAAGADDAIRVLGATHIDVVFSDVRMPGVTDGHGLADWIRQNKPKIKIVLGSGVDSEIRDEAIVKKPYDQGELLRRIRTVLTPDR
jgi:CheY-like chemotaxis protein